MAIERRFSAGTLEARDDSETMTIRGYGAVFDKNSENLGGFIERIAPGAFDDVLQDDVRGLFNHDSNLILGRTKAGTLRMFVDEKGLGYEIDLPDTQVGRDLMESIKRGDVSQSSFAFTVAAGGADWTEPEEQNGLWTRTITKMGRLYDVSPVTYPAYPDTSVAARSLEEVKQSRGLAVDVEQEHRARAIELISVQAPT